MAMNGRESKKIKDLRIVIVGKTGVGKSACGNTILGRREFKSMFGATSVTTQSKRARAEVDGRDVYIVDTPGLFDTTQNLSGELIKEITKCIVLSSPGPHVILVIIEPGRFTREEQESVKKIQELFGRDSAKHTIVLFSHGDKLKDTTIEKYISESEPLRMLTAQCHGGYHVFRNEEPENGSQVTELLQKIDKMVARNGGGYYTTEMYKVVEAEIEKEKQRILKEAEEKRKKEEEKQQQLEKKMEALEKRIKQAQEEKQSVQSELYNTEEKLKKLEEKFSEEKQKQLETLKEELRKEREKNESLERRLEKLEKKISEEAPSSDKEDNLVKERAELGAGVGAGTGAAAGALVGATFGPVGMLIGSIAGALGGSGSGAAGGAIGGAIERKQRRK